MNSDGTDYEENFIRPVHSCNPHMPQFLPGVKGVSAHLPVATPLVPRPYAEPARGSFIREEAAP